VDSSCHAVQARALKQRVLCVYTCCCSLACIWPISGRCGRLLVRCRTACAVAGTHALATTSEVPMGRVVLARGRGWGVGYGIRLWHSYCCICLLAARVIGICFSALQCCVCLGGLQLACFVQISHPPCGSPSIGLCLWQGLAAAAAAQLGVLQPSQQSDVGLATSLSVQVICHKAACRLLCTESWQSSVCLRSTGTLPGVVIRSLCNA